MKDGDGGMTKEFFRKESVRLNKELERYKKAYNILMDYFDCFSDEDKKDIHNKLDMVGL